MASGPTPAAVMAGTEKRSKAYVIVVATVAAISGLLFGFDTAVINGALIFMRKEFGLTDLQTQLAASSLLLGCLLGAAAGGSIGDRFGRRKSLVFAAVLFTVSPLGAALARGLVEFSLARLVCGLAIGISSALTPVYITEIAPSRSRGKLVASYQLTIVIGILAAYLTTWRLASLGEASWRWMFGVGVLPALALIIGQLAIPESPRWLLAQDRRKEAWAILHRIATPAEADAQLTEVTTGKERRGSIRDLFAPSLRGRLTIALVLAVLQQVSGINTVMYYGSVMFSEHFQGASATAAIGANIAVGLVNLICTIAAMFFIDRLGRRALLLAASGGMTVCLGTMVVGLKVAPAVPAIAFASILLYVAFFAVGLGPGIWVYVAEIFPTNVRGRAMSTATGALWAACLLVTFTFLSIMHAFGIAGAFALYGALSFVTFAFVWKWLPETRGKSLEDIQRMWR